MIEAVGHEYMEEFFGCCESVLAENGLFVLQVMKVWEKIVLLSCAHFNCKVMGLMA
jgi:cyclopropane fatty-acyl-phospholipid synthase-like methyltransferase